MAKINYPTDSQVDFAGYKMDRSIQLPADPLWTVEEVATYLKLQPETIRSMARRGELPAVKIGKVWRFHKQAICEMLINMQKALVNAV